MKQLIIDDLGLQKLKKFDKIEEFVDFIKPFYPDINIKKFIIVEIEQALFHVYIKIIGKILYFSPEHMRDFLRSYLLKFEIANIKQIILGLITGMNLEAKTKRVNFLVEEYLENTEFINDLLNLTSLEEIQLLMRDTPYNQAIREGLLYFRNNNEIFVLEAFLDKLFYENLRKVEKCFNKIEKDMITSFIQSIIEIYNLRMIFRGIRNNIDRKLLNQFLVDEFFFLDKEKLNYLLYQEKVEEFFLKVEEYLKKNKELKTSRIKIEIVPRHFIWSMGTIYLNYYFSKFKMKIDNIEYSTIYQILELIIKKDTEIKFNVMPNIIRIIHDNFERLEKEYGDF